MEEKKMINKSDLIDAVHSAVGELTKKDIGAVYDAIFLEISNSLESGSEVNISGIGKFFIKTRKAHQGINPKTKVKISIPEKQLVSFKISKKLKEIKMS